MKNKKRMTTYLAAPAIAAILFAGFASTADAWGGFGRGTEATPAEAAAAMTEQFTRQATALGLSVDVVKAAWAEGKTMQDLIKEYKLDETAIQTRMHAQRQADMKERLQALVTNGVITQAQADTRLSFAEKQSAQREAGQGGRGGRHGGMGRGMGMMGF